MVILVFKAIVKTRNYSTGTVLGMCLHVYLELDSTHVYNGC